MALRLKGKGWSARIGTKSKLRTAGAGGRGVRKPTTIDGVKFPSKLEAKTYARLKQRERLGEISDLELTPKFTFVLNIYRGSDIDKQKKEAFGWPVIESITYKSDFGYNEKGNPRRVIHEAKGYETEKWKRNKRWFEKLYPELELRVTYK